MRRWLPLLALALAGCDDSATTTPPAATSTPAATALAERAAEPAPADPLAVDTTGMSAPIRAAIETATEAVVADRESADAWLTLGQRLHALELFRAARACYEEVLARDEDRPRAHYLRAEIDHRAGDLERAIEGYRRTEAISRERGKVGFGPAQQHAGECLIRLGRLDEAEEVLAAVAEEFPRYEAGRVAYADLLLLRGKAEPALAELRAVEATVPDDRRVVEGLARAQHLLGNREEARALTARSRTLDDALPFRDKLLVEIQALGLGLAKRLDAIARALDEGKHADALTAARELAKDYPENRQVLLSIGRAQAGMQDHAAALETFRTVMETWPDDEVRLLAGRSAVEVERPDLAAAWAREVLEDADSAPARSLLGRALLLSRDYDAAEEQYDHLFEQHGNLPVNDWMMWGLVATGRREFQLAIDRFDAALGQVPNFAAAHMQRGLALEALARWEPALEAFERAIALEPALPVDDNIRALRQKLGR